MCGIVGYVGKRQVVPVLLDGLRRLEYRGYDSAGVAIAQNGTVKVSKKAGRLSELEEVVPYEEFSQATIGIGHTRWATHGKPTDDNAHPHQDCTGDFTVIHNGIIENYAELRRELKEKGHVFRSETDTEVIAHLFEELYEDNLEETMKKVIARLEGSYALVVVSVRDKNKLLAARQDSPLVIGLGKGENLLASDIPALLPYTRETIIMEDGQLAILTEDSVTIKDIKGNTIEPKIFHVHWDDVAAEKAGYEHFMLKEIHEQPKALKDTLAGRITEDNKVKFAEGFALTPEMVRDIEKVYLIACGTAYHAGLVGKHLIEKLVGIPAEADVASEFRYRDPLVTDKTLVVVVSQSGETADTLAALRESKARGARVVAVTNVVGSSVAREADDVIYTWAGPEIAVASTKAYTTQLLALSLFAIYLAQERGKEATYLLEEIKKLPEKASRVLEIEARIKELAEAIAKHDDAFYIGRGLDFAVSLEGQLKLKEISYIHAEAYPAGELKHGTLALITEGTPVISLATQPSLYEKTVSNIQEVKARGAYVVGIVKEGDEKINEHADVVINIPEVNPLLSPIIAVLPLQLLSYYAAVARGEDVDKPRNLAKSVTVE